MQTKTPKLTIRDFAYVREPGIGQTYQNGPYMILVGRKTYSVAYKGQTFSWGLESITEAVEAVAQFELRRTQEAL
jgi:hypothetical protein